MAEKRVSVRLAATGGKQVRAELEGVGDAGAKGFGQMSREAELANANLAKFTKRIALAASAAITGAAAAGAAMVRSGLVTVDAQAKLAQSLGTTVASIQTLERAGDLAGVSIIGVEQATKDLTRRLSQAAAGSGPAIAALKRLGLSANDLLALPLDQRVGSINAAIEEFVPLAERAAVAGQLFGEEGSLNLARIDTAALRQATKDVRDFGVVVSEQDAKQIELTNDAISRLGLVWRGLANQLTVAVAPSLQSVADAMAAATRVGGAFQTSIEFLGNHIEAITRITAAFATLLAGRVVFALGAAALGLRGVTLGFVALRGALLRTGIGVVIVGLGELAFRLDAFGGAADESSKAQTRMNEALGLYAQVGGPNARAEAIASTKAFIADAAAKLSDAEATLALMRADAQRSAANALDAPAGEGAAFRGLPSSVTLDGGGVADAIQPAIDAIAKMQTELGVARGKLAELEKSDPAAPLNDATGAANGLAGALGGASKQASALSQFLSGLPGALAGAATNIAGLRAGIATLSSGGDAAAASVAKFRAELETSLRDELAAIPFEEARLEVLAGIEQKVRLFEQEQKLTAEYQAQVSALANVASAASEAGSAGAAAGAKLADAADDAKQGWDSVADALAAYAAKARDIGGGIGETLVNAFRSAEDVFADFVTTGKASFRDLATSIIADLARLSARTFFLGPIANLLAGAFSGAGGKGGILANVLHDGGVVGSSGPLRMVPAMAFAAAPRMHGGGIAGLRPDEVPAILQRGERVSPRGAQSGSPGPVSININLAGANGDRAIEDVAIRAVRIGLGQYDRTLPQRIQTINRDPRRVG